MDYRLPGEYRLQGYDRYGPGISKQKHFSKMYTRAMAYRKREGEVGRGGSGRE